MKFHVIGMVSKAEIKLVIENSQAMRKVTGIAVKYTALSNKLCFSDKNARKSSNVKQANKSTHDVLDKQVLPVYRNEQAWLFSKDICYSQTSKETHIQTKPTILKDKPPQWCACFLLIM